MQHIWACNQEKGFVKGIVIIQKYGDIDTF